jgi:2,5-furandicarboxylate decarboxylase 1
MRNGAIYHDLDPAHQEHNLAMVLGSESVVYDAVKRVVPGVKAVHVPPSGNCYYHAYVSLKKKVHGEGKLAAMAALTAMFPCKLAVAVDDDIDVYNEKEVLWAISTRFVADRDLTVISGVTADHLDPNAYGEIRTEKGDMMTKLIIDATKPVGLPFPTRISPPKDLWASMKIEDYI